MENESDRPDIPVEVHHAPVPWHGAEAEGPAPEALGTDTVRGGRGRRTAAVATGAVVLLGAGGAAAWAASSSPDGSTASPAAPSPRYGGPSPAAPGTEGGRALPRRGGSGPGLGVGALHGELTVPDGEGTKQVAVQRGQVTAVSPTSLSVKSTDGFTRTYVLTPRTRVNGTAGDTSTLAVGDKVGVLADLAGATATATRVVEPGARPDRAPDGTERHGFGHQGRPGGEGSPATPAPATPSPATPSPQGEGSSFSTQGAGTT